MVFCIDQLLIYVIKSGENVFDEKIVLKYAQNLNLDEIDTDNLRTDEIDQISSKISSFSSVRKFKEFSA